jgi:galactokinase/CTP:molybdopterin cytidylyltransferase MocA
MIASELLQTLTQLSSKDDVLLSQLFDERSRRQNSKTEILQQLILEIVREVYGGPDTITQHCRRLKHLCEHFLALFGDGPVCLLRAPARINVLGEHVDYVSYLPTASLTFGSRERDMLMIYRRSGSRSVRGGSTSAKYTSGSFELPKELPSATRDLDETWLSHLYLLGAPAPDWLNYAHGSVDFAAFKFGDRVKSGFDFVIDSTIPAGGGASSSSALVVLAGAAIRDVNGVVFDAAELARDSARAEWFIGTRGGSMDHTTICLAQPHHGVLINYHSNSVGQVSLPDSRFQWITFFSKPADKGREIMIEYNERAACSRVLIPAVIAGWEKQYPDRYLQWHEALSSFSNNRNPVALNNIANLVGRLPQTLSLETLQDDYPDAFAECKRSFPALIEDRARWPIALRNRAMHHAGEVNRVAVATALLEPGRIDDNYSVCESIGKLLNESHESLRDLYGVSTPEVEQLVGMIQADKNVFGARLMGGGFGGNVLALTTRENARPLVDRVQSDYYEPQKRDGVAEGSVMISTPGSGLSDLGLRNSVRSSVEKYNIDNDPTQLRSINFLVDTITVHNESERIWPIIVAAGRGSRAAASGLDLPKPLALVNGKPSIIHVLESLRAGLGETRTPIVIMSPDNEVAIRRSLNGQNVLFAVQPNALGTGDAVLNAYEMLQEFDGVAVVVWSTQPVIRAETYRRTLALKNIFAEYDMIVPTTLRNLPYAPIERDQSGHVRSARETHLESAESIPQGETNIGLFLLKNQTMLSALLDLKRRYWNPSTNSYERRGGELGFPNELINYLSGDAGKIFASPIADPREEQGIKRVEDVASCERFISELEKERI